MAAVERLARANVKTAIRDFMVYSLVYNDNGTESAANAKAFLGERPGPMLNCAQDHDKAEGCPLAIWKVEMDLNNYLQRLDEITGSQAHIQA